jgi:hypothetical protein
MSTPKEEERQEFGPNGYKGDREPEIAVIVELQRELENVKAQRDEYFAAMSEGSREAFGQRGDAWRVAVKLYEYIKATEPMTHLAYGGFIPCPFEAMKQVELARNISGRYQCPVR